MPAVALPASELVTTQGVVQIDRAAPADLPAMAGLLAVLFAQESEFTPDPAVQARGLALILEQPGAGLLLVARVEGTVVGMVNLLYTVSTALGAKVAVLEDVVVAPDHRNQGVGSLLLRAALDEVVAAGCKRVTLATDAHNLGAQRLYQRLGFELSSMRLLRWFAP